MVVEQETKHNVKDNNDAKLNGTKSNANNKMHWKHVIKKKCSLKKDIQQIMDQQNVKG